MKVEHLTGLSPALTKNQIERLTELAEYLERERLLNAGDKKVRDICTNGLAWIILISKDE